jgi:hypothetical protein
MGSDARAIAAATAPLSKAGSAAGFGSACRPRSRLLERWSPRRSRPRSRDELRRRRSRSRRSREELRPRAWCRSCPRSRGDGLRRRRSRWSRRSRSLSRPRSLSRSRPLSLSRSLSLSQSLSLSLSRSRCLPSPLLSVVPPSGLVSVDGPPPCFKALPPIRGGLCWGEFLLSCCDSKRLRSACSDDPSCSGAASPPVGTTAPQEASVPGTGGQEGASSWGACELTSASTMGAFVFGEGIEDGGRFKYGTPTRKDVFVVTTLDKITILSYLIILLPRTRCERTSLFVSLFAIRLLFLFLVEYELRILHWYIHHCCQCPRPGPRVR